MEDRWPGESDIHNKRERLRQIIRRDSFEILTTPITLSSGKKSNFYFDLKKTMSICEGINLIADIFLEMIVNENVTYIGGIESGPIPIVTAIVSRSGGKYKWFFVRKKAKQHGKMKDIEGQFKRGQTVIIFDDVTTTGNSIKRAIEKIRIEHGKVEKVYTVVDRLQGANKNLKEIGCELIPILTRRDFSE
ncbi:MAG: orotate phosphoribosyltransferase [Candidatus Ranarchaeia archaeon]